MRAGWFSSISTGTGHRMLIADEPILAANPAFESGTIIANRADFVFRAFEARSTNGTLTFCDRRGSDAARAIIVSYTGRPRVATVTAGKKPLKCPA